MSILDTFYILFESDAAKLDKGIAESEKKAKGLTDVLGNVDKAAGKVGGSLMRSLAELGGAVAATFALRAMTTAMFDAADAADRLDETASRLGIATETLGTWGDLLKKNGGSADSFAASIEGLNLQLTQIEVTGKSRAAPFLKELGIDLDAAANKGRTALDFLPDIADAFSKMDKTKSMSVGRRLGFDQSMIMTLQAGKREVEALLAKEKELGVVTQKQGEISAEFNDALDDTHHAMRSVWLGVSEYVLPPLTWLMEKFQKVAGYLREHSDFVVGLMIALGAAIAFYVLPPLFSMAAAAVVAFAPFIVAGAIIAALAAAFALLYDDIMTFIEGGDSMTGAVLEWLGSFELLNAAVDFLGELLRFLWGEFRNGVAAIADFIAQSEMIQGVFSAIGASIDFVLAPLRMVWELLKGLGSAVGSALQSAGKLLGKGLDVTTQALVEGKMMLAQASGAPLAAQTSNSISNTVKGGKNTSVQIGKVEVHTQATDAAGISKAIGGTMQTQMRQAVSNYDDGVLA